MSDEKIYLEKLRLREIRPTAMRLLVLREMMHQNIALSLSDLEQKIETADKSTLFRTIILFHEHHLVHSIDDGSGSIKYALCDDNCECCQEDQHIHFYCEKCGKTFCFKSLPVPEIKLPDGFTARGANFVFKGVCPNCLKK